MRFNIVGLGFDGDVLPLVTLGGQLQSRGHQVTFIGAPRYAAVAHYHKLTFSQFSSVDKFDGAMQEVKFLSTRYRDWFIARHVIEWNKAIYHSLVEGRRQAPVVISAHTGMLWADLLGRANANLSVVRVRIDPTRHPDERMREVLAGCALSRLRASLDARWQATMESVNLRCGYDHVKRLQDSVLATVPVIGLYPDWLVMARGSGLLSHRRDLHPSALFGFVPPAHIPQPGCLYPEKGKGKRRLLVFVTGTLGVEQSWCDRFYGISTGICTRMRCNGIVLGGSVPAALQGSCEGVSWWNFLPLRDVLPSATAIVHHGGIGTAAAAIEAGVPQLIVPRLFAQSSNARWLVDLGVARRVDEHALSVDNGVRALHGLITDRAVCQKTGQLMNIGRLQQHDRLCMFLEHRRGL